MKSVNSTGQNFVKRATGLAKALLCTLVLITASWGAVFSQTTIVNYDFNSGTSYATLSPALATNITSTPTSTEGFATFAGTATGAGAFTTNSTAGNALAMNNSSGTNTKYFQFQLGGSALSTYNSFQIYCQAQRSGTGAQVLTLAYSTDGSSYTNFATTQAPGNSSFSQCTFNLSAITAINNQSAVYFRILASGASGNGTLRIDNFQIRATVTASSPVLAITGTPTNHGSVCPGVAASSVQYTITNTGSAQADGVTVVSNDAQFVVSGLSSTTIAGSGGTATYTVTFTPASAGAKSASITVASTTSGSNSPTSGLTGTGTTPVAPGIVSDAATAVTSTTATLNGTLSTLGICPATTAKGFVYAETAVNADPLSGGTGVTNIPVAGVATGAFSTGLSSLPTSTGYSYKAYVFDGTTYTYGAVQTFTTLAPTPVLSTSTGSLTFSSQPPLVNSASQSFDLSGQFLTGAPGSITVTAPSTDFQVSNDNTSFGPSTTIAYSSATLSATPVYVRFIPQSSGAKSGNITFSGGGVSTPPTVALSGTATLDAPVATAALPIVNNGFTANWNTTAGATSYRLDVSTSSTFGAVATVSKQDFESSPASPVLTFSNTGGATSSGTNGASGAPANANLFVSGTQGWEVLNSTSTVEFANQSLSGFSNNQLSFRLAGMSVNAGNGIDAGDVVTVAISTDGGSTYSNELTVNGSTNNRTWDFTATGSASITYDGDNNATAFSSASDAAGISTVNISFPGAVTQVKVRITMTNNNASERWVIDDVELKGEQPSYVSGYQDLTVNGTAQAVTGLAANTTYYYRVRAADANGVTGNSNVITVTTYQNDVTTADFRTKTSGNFSSAALWQFNSGNLGYVDANQVPATTNGIEVQSTHTLTMDVNGVIGAGKTVLVNGTLNTTTNNLSGAGNFTLSNGAVLQLGSLSASGALADNLQLTGTTSFENGSTVEFNGTAAQFAAAATFSNLAINNSNGVSMLGNIAVNNVLNLAAGNLQIGSQTLTLNGSFTRTSGNLAGSNNASINLPSIGNVGTLFFEQSGTGNFLKNLSLADGTLATLGNALNITGGTSPGNEGVLTVAGNGVLTTGGFLTIKSNANGTARIAANTTATADYISGNVTVERFIPQNATKAWRLLASNTSGQTINQAWQEGQASSTSNTNPGFGTMITGTNSSIPVANSLGFDTSTARASIFKYDPATDNLKELDNTNATQLSSQQGYFIYIRGDRQPGQFGSSTTANSSTTLRSTGSIFQRTAQSTSLALNQWQLLRNPFASAIDVRNVSVGAGVVNAFQVWDPQLAGTYGLGGYQTLTENGGNYVVTPGGGSYPVSGSIVNTIESGAAFFVQAAAGGTVTVGESAKTSGSNLRFRPAGNNPLAINSKLITNLYAANGTEKLADGNMILFDNSFSKEIDVLDVKKSPNFGEDFAIVQAATDLVVERRALPAGTDTLFYSMRRLKKVSYKLELIATDIDNGLVAAFLEDTYTHTLTPVNLSGTTSYGFSVDDNAASAAAARFRIVFGPLGAPLPVSFTSIKAAQVGAHSVGVEWKVANQATIVKYEVEKSTNGRDFVTAGTRTATSGNGEISYSWLDENAATGVNYYRVKSTDAAGVTKYSGIARVVLGKQGTGFSISPNPVRGTGSISLQLDNVSAGRYAVRLYNQVGQVLVKTSIAHAGGSSAQSFTLPAGLAKGIYQFELTAPDKTRQVKKLVIE